MCPSRSVQPSVTSACINVLCILYVHLYVSISTLRPRKLNLRWFADIYKAWFDRSKALIIHFLTLLLHFETVWVNRRNSEQRCWIWPNRWLSQSTIQHSVKADLEFLVPHSHFHSFCSFHSSTHIVTQHIHNFCCKIPIKQHGSKQSILTFLSPILYTQLSIFVLSTTFPVYEKRMHNRSVITFHK